MATFTVDGVDLFYTDTGVPDGADPGASAVVLVHGWGCDSHDWLFQHDPFAEHHRVVALDLRAHGRSSTPATGLDGTSPDYTAQRYAADIAALVGALALGPVVAAGHSLGGSVVAALAVENPELVRGCVSVEPAYGQDATSMDFLRGAADQFGTLEGNALAAQLQGATEPNTPAWLKTWHARRTLGAHPATLRDTFRGMYCVDDQISGQPATDPYLHRRTAPVLAFHRLPTMAAWERRVLDDAGHPASHVVVWEGAGHWLHQERVADFNALTLAWIADLP